MFLILLLSMPLVSVASRGCSLGVTLWTDLNMTVLPSADSLFRNRCPPPGQRVTIERIAPEDGMLTPSTFSVAMEEDNYNMLVVNCLVRIDSLLDQTEWPCWCYEVSDPDQLYDCPHTIERNQVELLLAIMKQSVWRDAIAFTDITSALSDEITVRSAYISMDCDMSRFNITDVIDAYVVRDDYINILIDCEDETTLRILQQVKQAKATIQRTLKRSNYLMTTNGTLMDISNFRHLVIDGDNAGVVMYEKKTYSWRNLAEMMLDPEYVTLPSPGFRIERCMSDCNKRHAMMYVGVYHNAEEIFQREDRILSAVFQQFYGRTIIVAAGDYPPYYIAPVGNHSHGGMGYELVKLLSIYFNYTLEVVPPVDRKWGSMGPDGRWNGMVGMVLYGTADFCIGGITISQERRSAIDFTTPHHEETNAVLLNLPWKRWGFFYEVFHKGVWSAVITLPLIATLVLWLLERFVEDRFFGEKQQAFIDMLFRCYGIGMLQGMTIPLRSFAGRIILFSFWLTVIITMATYTGNLTASLAVRKVTMPFTTLREIAENDDYILTIKPGSIREALFQSSPEGSIYRALWKKIQKTPDKSFVKGSADAIARMTKDPSILYTADKTAIRNRMILTGSCSLVLLPEEYFSSGFGIGMRKGSPQIEHFNAIIRRVIEMGLTKFWESKYEIKDVCGDLTQASASGSAIGMEDSFWLFVILAGGLSISLTVLIAEFVMVAIRLQRNRKEASGSEKTSI